MAIAFDASSTGESVAGATSLTFAHTCTGSDRILFVATAVIVPNGVNVSGITYNGVALTKVNESNPQTNIESGLWYLIAPSTGANNIVISAAGTNASTIIGGVGMSYTGAQQSGVPDSSAIINTTTTDPFTQSTTTVADNCWVVASAYSNTAVGASTGATSRNTAIGGPRLMGADSNGPKTPAGSYSMSFTNSGGDSSGLVMASFAPAGGAAARLFTLLGVGT